MSLRSSLLAFLALLPSCALYDDAEPDPWPGASLPACETTRRAYRIDRMVVPDTSSAAEELGWDFDDDGTIDNQGGNIISAVRQAVDVDLAGAVQEALDADLVQIAVVLDQCAGPDYTLVSLVRGVELDRSFDPPRLLAEPVTAFAAVGTDGAVATDGTTQFPVGQLVHPFVTEWIDAEELVVDVEFFTETGIEGRMMAVLDYAQEFATVTEAFQRKITDRIDELGADDEVAITMLELFDHDTDGVIELAEVREDSLVQSLLRADVDLDGDGVEDALSIGVGFHAAPVDLYLRE